jgi:hypothetical protein
MELIQQYRVSETFCRQRAKVDSQDELFWLREAEILAKLATNARRLRALVVAKRSPDQRA